MVNHMVLSIIVPLYKGEKYVLNIVNMCEKACEVAEISNDAEIIFVNDYPEEKINIVNSSIKTIVIKNNQNEGIHRSRVVGLEAASGEYVHFLDQDDRISEEFYISTLPYAKNKDVVVTNGIVELTEKGSDIKKIYRNRFDMRMVKHRLAYVLLDNRILSPGHCIIRKRGIPSEWCKETLRENGADDFLLWNLLLKNKCSFEYVDKTIYTHINTGNNSSSDESMMLRSLTESVKILDILGSDIYTKMLKSKVKHLNGQKNLLGYLLDIMLFVRKLRLNRLLRGD